MNSPQTQNPPNPEHASLMADMFLGAANNIIEVGSGFFVRLNPSAEMQEYDELIQVIDQQNEQNIHRLKLDESDRAMIRPLLAAVLAKRGAVLSPEHQLAIAFFSILIKKAQVILQIRNENQILAERIRMIIREAKEEENNHAVEPEPSLAPEPEVEVEVEPKVEKEDAVSHTEESDSPIGEELSQEAPVNEHQDQSEAQEYNDSMQALRRAREEELERRKAAGEPIIQEEGRSTPEPGENRSETRSERRRREREEKKQKRSKAVIATQSPQDES